MIKDFYMGGAVYTLGGNIEVLPNGRILAPIPTLNAVIEFDWEGNKHWQASVTSPVSLSRLPSGNTLVTCMDYRIVEIDRDGKEVWTYQTEGRPFCARRR
jgi:outer membrane protein assembly factor BamB